MENKVNRVFDLVKEIISAGDVSSELRKLKELQTLLSKQEATQTFFSSSNSLNVFLSYLFDRRFGWSDERLQAPFKLQKHPQLFEDENRIKKALNEVADEFFFFLKQQPITALLLSAITHVIENAENKPVVREQTFKYFFDWMNHQTLNDKNIQEKVSQNFSFIEPIVVVGLTDVWSQIRKGAAFGLYTSALTFNLEEIRLLFSHLQKICMNPEATWQAKEGAILGIYSILKVFQAGIADSKEELQTSMDGLPEFILQNIRSVLYVLLAHPQLSIRENAIKAYALFLVRTKFQETLNSFPEVISKLMVKFPSSFIKEIPTSIPENPWLDDAYYSESLLGVCAILVKSTSFFALPFWESYFFTFLLYLSHPASTVRQECSSIFRHILARNSQPAVIRLILQSLVSDWPQFMDFSTVITNWNFQTIHSPIASTTQNYFINRWEWKEGRLLALELVLKFLINNHIHYIFPFSPRKNNTILASPVAKSPSQGQVNVTLLRRSISAQEISSNQMSAPVSLLSIAKINNGPVSLIDQIVGIESGNFVPQKTPFAERLQDIKMIPTSKTFQASLIQLAECMQKETQWELTRIAEQVLPLLTESIFFINLELLEAFWSSILLVDTNRNILPLCLLACKSLKVALKKSVNLEEKPLKMPHKQWARSGDKDRVRSLTDKMETLVPKFASHVYLLAQKDESDKLLIECTELLMLIHTHWGSKFENKQEKINFTQTAISNLSQINTQNSKRASQMKNAIINKTFSEISSFVLKCELHQMLTFIPFLLDSVVIQDDPEVQLGLLSAISAVFQAFLKCLEVEEGVLFTVLEAQILANTSSTPKHLLSETSNLCVNKLLELMATKTLETVIIRKVLEVIHHVCLVWDDLRHLNSVFLFLSKNMNQDVIGKALSIKQQQSTLQILSNDIISHTPNLDDINEEGLNNDNDSDSEYENWDDDDDGDTDVQINVAEIGNFLNKLKSGFSSDQPHPQTSTRRNLGLDQCKRITYEKKFSSISESQQGVIRWITSKFNSESNKKPKALTIVT